MVGVEPISAASFISYSKHQNDQPGSTGKLHSFEKSNNLVIILAWISAKDKHVAKYREIYFKRGFDVLTLRTNPIDMMLPAIGSRKNAQDLLNYLTSKENNYSNIVVHGFSVGAYQFGEVLIKLRKILDSKDKQVSSQGEKIVSQIKGLIFDSAADVHNAPSGLSRSVAREGFNADLIKLAIKFYLTLFYPLATRYYYKSATAFYNNFLLCPALLLFSEHDKIADAKSNYALAEKWKKRGVTMYMKEFDRSRHVTHLHQYPEEYEKQIETFLDKIELKSQWKFFEPLLHCYFKLGLRNFLLTILNIFSAN